MIARLSHAKALPRTAIVLALLALGIGLSGCASTSMSDIKDDMSLDNATLMLVDPARYDFYDCKQLQIERKSIASHIEEGKKMMAKADTGFAGPVVAEIVYRNDYLTNLGQAKLADQAWKRNKCHEVPLDPPGATPDVAAPPPADAKGKHGPSRSGSAVY